MLAGVRLDDQLDGHLDAELHGEGRSGDVLVLAASTATSTPSSTAKGIGAASAA